MGGPTKISATIITFNEERKIENCIQSLLEVVDEIVVVDSYSTDRTENICSKYPVRFIKHAFEGYVAQKNYAMNQASNDVILSLDADERLSEKLKQSILIVKNNWDARIDGYEVNRFNNYCGHWIRFCGWYPDRKIRLWDRRKGSWQGTDPHDKVKISKDRVQRLNGDLLHFAYFSVDEHLRQMSKFAEVAAKAKFKKGVRPIFVIHVILNPLFKFFKKYILQLGFLDGYYGFVFCAAASSLNFFKYLRLYEYHRRGLPE
ncbi:glycosyltransferase family 2 protein [Chryseosolibacter indicus]|uniref:Glycosyltransferase family 2 protein n=1 Tax=Chryseosolibacter indicus TaxID=2782351 RepID=A0ABS5VJN9_9BACT|nr:glycosyltransferase family 2 protein [Chryseosolibacter indicus]MBT1701655.1 glycosyltransferase family 2 protein [Chryseosolibacter indicus]